MSSDSPSFQSLLQSVSTAQAATADPQATVEAMAELITRHLGSVNVSISLQTSRGSLLAFAERQSSSSSKGRFLFTRRISLRGTAYGRFSLEVDVPRGGASAWLQTLETLIQQLALYAERQHLKQENERLLKSARALKEELRLEKVLARASGIVAISNGLTAMAARQWIAAVARKKGLDLFAVSDQIILHHVVRRQFEVPSSSPSHTGGKEWAAA